jgi:hypothetical protein
MAMTVSAADGSLLIDLAVDTSAVMAVVKLGEIGLERSRSAAGSSPVLSTGIFGPGR